MNLGAIHRATAGFGRASLPMVKQLGEKDGMVTWSCPYCGNECSRTWDALAGIVELDDVLVDCTCRRGRYALLSQDALLQWEMLHREARG